MSLIGQSPAGKYSVDRPVEWILSGCMISWGVTTLLSPRTIELGSFRYIGTPGLGINWLAFALVTLIFGVVWVYALIRNGEGLPWTARTRWLCSVVCCATLSFMAFCLGVLTSDTGTYSLGIGSHIMWALGALYSCLRAGIDATDQTSYKPVVNVAIVSDVSDGASSGDSTGSIRTISDITIIRGNNANGDNRNSVDVVAESRGVRETEGGPGKD